ncbi:MAG: helix-turn-helix domain-containing protein [Terrisporobacter sp.]
MELSLLKKAKKGDKKALKKLMINNSEYIYKLAFMHTKYEDDAKIIMKNTRCWCYCGNESF